MLDNVKKKLKLFIDRDATAVLFPICVLALLFGDRAINDAQASALDCERIRDADRRHMCRAVSIPRPSECEFIKESDLRNECRARVKVP